MAKLIVVRLVLFCLGKCPISSRLSLAGGLVRVGSGQSQVQIHSNRGRGLGDCWPLRPCEAAGLGLLVGTLPPAGGSPHSYFRKLALGGGGGRPDYLQKLKVPEGYEKMVDCSIGCIEAKFCK